MSRAFVTTSLFVAALVAANSAEADVVYTLSAFAGARDGNSSSINSWTFQLLAIGAVLTETTGNIKAAWHGQRTTLSWTPVEVSSIAAGPRSSRFA